MHGRQPKQKAVTRGITAFYGLIPLVCPE